jgi:hypothetical protein
VSRRLNALVLACALSACALVSGATAYFLATGKATGSVTAGRLGTSTIESAASGAGSVTLKWSTVASPGASVVDYYVTRDGGTPAGNCPTGASPSAATSCTDGEVPLGTHAYRVIAVWKSWSTTSASASATVAFGPATHLTLEAASITPTAGSADNLTIAAKDASGNTVQTYTGTHSLTFTGASSIGTFTPTVTNSSGTATAFGANTSIQFSSGVAKVSGSNNGLMKLYKAETASIVVSDGSIDDKASPLSVTVGPAGAATLVVFGYPSPTISGTSHSFNVTAKDSFGNTATGYAGTVHFTSSDTAATLPANYAYTTGAGADNGTHTFSATLKTFGSQSITATDTLSATIAGTQSGIVVTASKLVLSAATTTPPTGTADSLTITAQDAVGNTATNYTGAHSLTFTGANASPNGTQPTVSNSAGTAVNLGSATSIEFANGIAKASGSANGVMTLYKAETASVTVSDGSIGNSSSPLSMTVGAPAAPAGSSTKYGYGQLTSPTPDTITGSNGTLSFGGGQTSLQLVAIESSGPHVGQQFASSSVASTGNGSVPTFNVDNAKGGTVAYKFAAKDTWGNLSAEVGPVSFTDNG